MDSCSEPVRLYNFIGSKGLRGDEAAVGRVETEEEAIICEKCQDGETQEEVRAPKIARRPGVPTKAEIDAHYPMHAEFRDWCRYWGRRERSQQTS